MPMESGDNFAGFAVVRHLGAGPLGDVYLADDTRPDRKGPRRVALKIPSDAAARDGTFCFRFVRGATPATRLFHPNLVKVHDVGDVDGRPWAAMDYVEGADAEHVARRYQGGMPVSEVCTVVAAISDALDYIHQCQCWHRAVKPTNVLLADPQAGERRIMLSDFTTGRTIVESAGLDGAILDVKTLGYTAPEELLSPESLDHRVDQYALAATAFRLLTGAPPHHGRDLTDFVGQLVVGPPLLSIRRPELAALDAVFVRALATKPADRFDRCHDFAVALAAALPEGTRRVGQ